MISKKLRVYHIHDGTWRYMVAASNQKMAVELLNCTLGGLRSYGGTITSPEAIALATSEPGVIWRQHMTAAQQPWERDWEFRR